MNAPRVGWPRAAWCATRPTLAIEKIPTRDSVRMTASVEGNDDCARNDKRIDVARSHEFDNETWTGRAFSFPSRRISLATSSTRDGKLGSESEVRVLTLSRGSE